eukprot:scaffold13689_cov126-Isochrysis_galbana.AAC.2
MGRGGGSDRTASDRVVPPSAEPPLECSAYAMANNTPDRLKCRAPECGWRLACAHARARATL